MKVGHRQAFIPQNPIGSRLWGFVFVATKTWRQKAWSESLSPVSYTHLTLPTIYSV